MEDYVTHAKLKTQINRLKNSSFVCPLIFFFLLFTTSGNDFQVRYLRLLAPPLQLLSAAVWQIVQQGLVDHYGMLEEFVTMVTELVPELMSYSQRAQLILGLRAKVYNTHFSVIEILF